MSTDNKAQTGQRVLGQGKINVRSTFSPDHYEYLMQVHPRDSQALRDIVAYCFAHIQPEKIKDFINGQRN